MTIERFEDLLAWKAARLMTRDIYALFSLSNIKHDYRLRDQATGAATSVMNNISEGFGSQMDKEFIRFLLYARRSCSEVQNCLYIGLDQQYFPSTKFQDLYEQTSNIRRMIDGLLRYLRSRR